MVGVGVGSHFVVFDYSYLIIYFNLLSKFNLTYNWIINILITIDCSQLITVYLLLFSFQRSLSSPGSVPIATMHYPSSTHHHHHGQTPTAHQYQDWPSVSPSYRNSHANSYATSSPYYRFCSTQIHTPGSFFDTSHGFVESGMRTREDSTGGSPHGSLSSSPEVGPLHGTQANDVNTDLTNNERHRLGSTLEDQGEDSNTSGKSWATLILVSCIIMRHIIVEYLLPFKTLYI